MSIIPDKMTSGIIVEMKNYDFSNPVYQRPFMQSVVIRDVVNQAEKYLATGQPVVFQFSQSPPGWLSDVLGSLSLDANVSFVVAP